MSSNPQAGGGSQGGTTNHHASVVWFVLGAPWPDAAPTSTGAAGVAAPVVVDGEGLVCERQAATVGVPGGPVTGHGLADESAGVDDGVASALAVPGGTNGRALTRSAVVDELPASLTAGVPRPLLWWWLKRRVSCGTARFGGV